MRVTDSNTTAATADRTVVVNIAGTNDTPFVYSGFAGLDPTHTAYRGSPVVVFGTSGRSLVLSTVETAQKFDQVVLTVSNVTDGSHEKLIIGGVTVPLVAGTTNLTDGGVATTTVSGTNVTVTLDWASGITPANVDTLLCGIAYKDTKPAATVATRLVTLASITDNGGGAATLNGSLKTSAVSVIRESVAPVVTSVITPADGIYKAGDTLTFTVHFSEEVDVTGAPRIGLVIGSTTRYLGYVSGSGTTALVFAYTLVLADTDNDGVALGSALELNGGTIRDLAENDLLPLTLAAVPSTAGIKVNLRWFQRHWQPAWQRHRQ